MLGGQLNNTRVESILRRAIQVGNTFKDGSNAIDNRAGEGLVFLDASLQVFQRGDFWQQEHLSVGCPEHNYLVIAGLAGLDVGTHGINELLVGAHTDIVASVSLVGSDEVRVEHSGKGLDLGELILELLKEGRLKNLGALGSLMKVSGADVPTTDIKVNGGNHGEQILDWQEDVLEGTSLLIHFEANMSGGTLGERAMEVGLDFASPGLPGHGLSVGDEASCESGAIVAAKTDEHDTELGHLLASLDRLGLDDGTNLAVLEESEAVLVLHVDVGLSF